MSREEGFRLFQPGDRPRLDDQRQRWAIARENHSAVGAPGLDPTDARWVLAARVRSQLQGSVLTPERRDQLMRTARVLGLRPFEASVIVAIVQDQARRGAELDEVESVLALLHPPVRRSSDGLLLRIAVAMLCALTATALLIRWILNG